MDDNVIRRSDKEEKNFEELHKIALKAARNIHLQDKVEHGRSIDIYGNVEKFAGGCDWVDIAINTNTRMAVHNHPNEYKEPESFSDCDIYHFLSKKYLWEVIVCGYGYYFYLRRGSFNGLSGDVQKDVLKIRAKVKREVKKEYLADERNNNKTIKRKMKELTHAAEARYHEELSTYLREKGLSYGKEKL